VWTDFDLPANIIRDCDWTLMCERILLWSLSSLLRQLRTASYSVSCWVNIFSLANYIMLTSLDEYFSTTILVTESCTCCSLFMHFLSMTISWRHISQSKVTRLRCGGIFNYYFYRKCITESNSERWKNFENRLRFDNVTAEFGDPVFWNTVCTCCLKSILVNAHALF